MNRADVLLNDGTVVTWTTKNDELHHVEVLPAGALAVHVWDPRVSGGVRLRYVYAFGLWLTVTVDDPAWG